MKIITAASAILFTLVLCGAAQAQMRSRPVQNYGYLFAEYDHYSASGGSLNGGGLGVGWRLNRYFAVQAGGQYSRKSGVDYTNGYAEALLHMPFTPRFSLYGSIGGAYAQAETSFTAGTPPTTFKISTSSSGYRAGAGMEYWMTPEVSLRAGYRRQNALFVADDISVGLGLRF